MKIREYFQLQWARRFVFLVVALYAPALLWLLFDPHHHHRVVGLVLWGAGSVASLVLYFLPFSRAKCPRCGAPFGSPVPMRGKGWTKVEHCSHCGVSLDEPYEEAGKPA
jgi:hypothetical protein